MKEKKLLIALIVFTVAFGSYFSYRHFGNKKKTVTSRKDNYTRLVNMAKTNPKSGLAQMARALNKHFADKKFYPANLKALYPNYIKTKALLDDIEWDYSRRGSSFLLSKTVSKEGRRLTASIDESLRFGAGRKTMLAESDSETLQPEEPFGNNKKQDTKPETKRITASQNERKEDTIEFDDFAISAYSKNATGNLLLEAVEDDRRQAELKPPVEAVPAVADNKSTLRDNIVAGLGGRYLIWRDKNGHLGFSNIQYPEKSDVEQVYVEGGWQRFRN